MINKNTILLLLIVIFALFLRLPQIISDQIPFAFDMGRDMIWAQNLILFKDFFLIGPWTALSGIFFGPFWWYLLSIGYIFTGGNPQTGALIDCSLNIIALILAYYIGAKLKSKRLGLIIAFLIAISPLIVNISTAAFNPYPLALTTLLLIWSLYQFSLKKYNYLILSSLLIGISFHWEPATAIFLIPVLFVYVLLNLKVLQKIKICLFSIFAFILPFIPQIIFELRHNFSQTRAFIGFVDGSNESLKGQMPLMPRLSDRLAKYFDLYKSSVLSSNSNLLPATLLVISAIILYYIYIKSKNSFKKFILVNILIIFIPLLAYIFLFKPELKTWYLCGFSIPIIILSAIVINWLWEKSRAIGIGLIIFFVLINVNFVSLKEGLLNNAKPFTGPEILSVQKEVIDYIYNDAQGKSFSVYVYTPPIYDYHYQYLFWWYGKKQHNYWPEQYSYLPGKTDYLPSKEKYLEIQHQKQPQKEPEFIYLIIEPDKMQDRIDGWKGHFASQKFIKSYNLNEIIIEKRVVSPSS